MKAVGFPRGDTAQESAILGVPGQVRVDMSRGTVRVHDGERQGGFELPNVDIVRAMIAEGPDAGGDGSASLVYYTTQAELVASIPTPGAIGIVGEVGLEEVYFWKPGAGDGGTLTSDIDGQWHRLDSRVGFYVRLYRAGCINMQFAGAAPVADQDITAWLDGSTVKLWDGAAYQVATPVLFTRLLSKIGNYDAAIVFPDRLAELLVEAADLNAVAVTGWSKSAAADGNAPSAVVSPVFTFVQDANVAYQQFFVQTSTTRDYYVRSKAAGAWNAWTFIQGTLPDRLGATALVATDANTALDSGFYKLSSAASNIPAAENGTIVSRRYDSTNAQQTWVSVSANKIYFRRYVASVWQAWVQVFPADGSLITGTVPRVNIGITTISQAEAEAGTATTDRIFTAERVAQAITNLIGGALRTLRALTLVAGDLLYATGAGVLVRLAKGTAGQILTMNAGATAPEWQTPAASGGMTLLGTITLSGAVTRSLTGIPAGYKALHCDIKGASVTTGGTPQLTLATSSTNGAAYGTARAITAAFAVADSHYGVVEIFGIDSAVANEKTARASLVTQGNSNAGIVGAVLVATNTAAVLDAIQFANSAGQNFDAGTIDVYGVR